MTIERNLVLVHTPGYQDVADFQAIAGKVQELAPDIEVYIASNNISSSVTRRLAGRRPALVFSPGKLLSFRPARGKVYAGSPIPKLEQIARFQTAGLPVPASAEITPDPDLPERTFGPYVVVKPGFSRVLTRPIHHIDAARSRAVSAEKNFPGGSSRSLWPDVCAKVHRHRAFR